MNFRPTVCRHDGSPLRLYETYGVNGQVEFSIFQCEAAGHSLRVGAPAPPAHVQGAVDPMLSAIVAVKRHGHSDLCAYCPTPALEGDRLCRSHRAQLVAQWKRNRQKRKGKT